MKSDETILNIGKSVFWLSLLLGNICLFGYIITRDSTFALGGLMLLLYGSIVNVLVIGGLLIYGFNNKSELTICFKASKILLINIPIAILYAIIGLNIM